MPSLENEIAEVLNKNSVENESNTPDFVLAEYLIECLKAWKIAVIARDKFYGLDHTKNF